MEQNLHRRYMTSEDMIISGSVWPLGWSLIQRLGRTRLQGEILRRPPLMRQRRQYQRQPRPILHPH